MRDQPNQRWAGWTGDLQRGVAVFLGCDNEASTSCLQKNYGPNNHRDGNCFAEKHLETATCKSRIQQRQFRRTPLDGAAAKIASTPHKTTHIQHAKPEPHSCRPGQPNSGGSGCLFRRMEHQFRDQQRGHGPEKRGTYNLVWRSLFTILKPVLQDSEACILIMAKNSSAGVRRLWPEDRGVPLTGHFARHQGKNHQLDPRVPPNCTQLEKIFLRHIPPRWK